MTKKRFRHMPVFVYRELLGLVTIGDIVKARLTELEMEKETLEGMIMGYNFSLKLLFKSGIPCV